MSTEDRQFLARLAWFIINTLVYTIYARVDQVTDFRKREKDYEAELDDIVAGRA